MVVTIGVDSHKATHTVVAVDELGRVLGEKQVRATSEGYLALVLWAVRFGEVVFALEDCRHLTRRLEGDLLRAGHPVMRVPTRLMAQARRSGGQPGKSDPIDAEAVAHPALRYPDPPRAELDGPAREVELLSDHGRDLVIQRTRIAAQVRWHLHELDRGLEIPSLGCAATGGRPAPRSARRHPRGGCSDHPRPVGPVRRVEHPDRRTRRRAAGAGPCPGPGPARDPRLWRGVGGGDHRRDRRGPPVPVPRRVRPVHRHRPGAGPVRRLRRQGAAQPGWEPRHDLRPAHHRDHPGPPRHRPRLRLHRQTDRPRQGHHRRTPNG